LTKDAGFVITQSLLNSFKNRLENCAAVESVERWQDTGKAAFLAGQAAKLSAVRQKYQEIGK